MAERAAVLEAFDGSFFKGRYYARQPEAMIDVGNDREFGFLYQPNLSELEATFSRLLTVELPPRSRRRALQLASFFQLPGRTHSSSITTALLRRLFDPDLEVRAAARAIVGGDDFNPDGAEDDPERIAIFLSALEGSAESRQSVLKLI